MKATVPNYQRIKQALLEKIAHGGYVPDRPFVTQQEVCQRFGVSRITAERAINELVRDGFLVRQRGRGTFVATNTPLAVSSAFQSAGAVIAYIVSAAYSDHKTAIIQGIESMCREADYHLLFLDSDDSAEIEQSNLQRAVRADVAGIMVYPVDGFANTARFEALQREGVPIVMIDRYYPSVATPAVVPDHLAAGYQLTEFLIQQGHRYIGTIWSEVACSSVHERLIGYKQALREYHLPIEADLAALRSYTKLSQEQRHDLLSSWLGAPYRPTAIIAANGTVLGTVVPDLLSLGVRLGEDIILGAMDNADLGIPHALGAATITLPSYEIGREAMRLLLERLQGGKVVAQHIVLPIRLSTPSLVVNSHAVS